MELLILKSKLSYALIDCWWDEINMKVINKTILKIKLHQKQSLCLLTWDSICQCKVPLETWTFFDLVESSHFSIGWKTIWYACSRVNNHSKCILTSETSKEKATTMFTDNTKGIQEKHFKLRKQIVKSFLSFVWNWLWSKSIDSLSLSPEHFLKLPHSWHCKWRKLANAWR